MKKFDALYKRTKTGAIQSYQLSVCDRVSTTNMDYAVITKETGQLKGKKVIHQESVLVGKNLGKSNETTPYEQAILQAESDWKRKKDEGYKSLDDLNIRTFTDEKIDTGIIYEYEAQNGLKSWTNTLESVLERNLPRFNSDAKGNTKPMLAQTVNWNKVTYPCLVQPKLDGVRCLLLIKSTIEGGSHTQRVQYFSRKGKEYLTLGHISNDIHQYLIDQDESVSLVLDGEIYSDELTFQEIVAAVKKQSPNSAKLKFRAYDIVNQELQRQRWEDTKSIVRRLNSKYVQLVDTIELCSRKEIEHYHDDMVAEGYEGAIIRLMDGHYAQGQRSSHLLKVKQFDEAEFAFKNFEFGQRGVEDLIAVCWVQPLNADTQEGQVEFRAKMVGTKAQKQELYSRDDLEGKSLTVKHFGWTDDGLPRFPIGKSFRDYESI